MSRGLRLGGLWARPLGGTLTVLILSGFLFSSQVDLYKNLKQEEANQMLALLLVNGISAKKTLDSSANALTLSVSNSDFVRSVELLTQNGFPRKQYLSVSELFPSNQLVSSPVQEAAKLNYLKEQRLENLLAGFEGVIQVSAVIAEVRTAQTRRENGSAPSAAIFIRHSPEVNMENFIIQIKSLVKNSVPGLEYEGISVVLQPASSRSAGQRGDQTVPGFSKQGSSLGSTPSATDVNPSNRGA